MGNSNLNNARTAKADEFYTQRADIEKEMKYYERHFAGKVVYCNCDDPAKSQFVAYFRDNYERLGLAGLLTNHLCADGSGDFRGREAMAKLERADVVVTNPPFSLFRQFIAQLVEIGGAPLFGNKINKKFLVIANITVVSNYDTFPLVKAGIIWAGVNSGGMDFETPQGTFPIPAMWLTNLEHGQSRPLKLTRKYDPEFHKKYENYDAINVNRVKDIPCDYHGLIGVPTTILLGYDLNEFDIIGASGTVRGLTFGIKKWNPIHRKAHIKNGGSVREGNLYSIIDGITKNYYHRIIIRKKSFNQSQRAEGGQINGR